MSDSLFNRSSKCYGTGQSSFYVLNVDSLFNLTKQSGLEKKGVVSMSWMSDSLFNHKDWALPRSRMVSMSWMSDSLFNNNKPYDNDFVRVFLCPECRTHCLTVRNRERQGDLSVSMSWMSDSLFNQLIAALLDSPENRFLCPECRTHCLTRHGCMTWDILSCFYVLNVGLTV